MYIERSQSNKGIARSLNGSSTQSLSINPQGSSLSTQSSVFCPHHSKRFPSISPRGFVLSSQSSTLSPQHSTQSPSFSPEYSKESATRCQQHLFINVSTELLRQGQSVRFRAPGRSMHPTIKEGETITVVPVAPFDIKRGDVLLYLLGSKVVAHRVISIDRKKDNSMTHSSPLNPQHLFILRGDASATFDDPVEAQQVLGKVVSVEKRGRSIDLYSRKARMLRLTHALASRLKKLILRIIKPNWGAGLTFGGLQ